jgi:phosphoglycolate phosphatase
LTVEAVVFDLDGTLVDTAADIAAAVNRTLAADGLRPLSPAQVEPMIGRGATVLIALAYEAAGAPLDPAEVPATAERYLARYAEHPAEHARPYADAPDALAALRRRGIGLAVCTNKRTSLARAVLEATGLAPFLGGVVGPDMVSRRKPDPAHLGAAVEAIGADPARTLYVGDGDVDVQTARAAGVRYAIVAWGRAAAGAPQLRRFADLLPPRSSGDETSGWEDSPP